MMPPSGNDPYGSVVTWIDRPPLPGPLEGLRIGVKDLIAVAGVPRLCGAPAMVDATPSSTDAPAVARLVAAGAQLVATTATHQFGWGVLTPGTRNPRAPGRIAGGSSGGSAAALAGGIVDGALGTDTAGSIRIPAACCGVVGLKPSEGTVPREGVQPLAPSFDIVGPLARDVETVARLQAVLSGRDVRPVPPSPLRVGVVAQLQDVAIDPDVRTAQEAMLEALRRDGARLMPVALPEVTRAPAVTMTILAAEERSVHAATIERYGSALSPGVRRAFERAAALPGDDVLAARREAALWRHSLRAAFWTVDVLVLPVLPCRVPAVGADVVDVEGTTERVGAALTRLTSPWSLAGVCAAAVPVSRDGDGAPVALQVVGPWGGENSVLGVAALLQQLAGGAWPAVSTTG